MRELRHIPVGRIRKGDEFVSEETGQRYWTAAEHAQVVGDEVRLRVQHADGGYDTRVWDEPVELAIVRDWPEEGVKV